MLFRSWKQDNWGKYVDQQSCSALRSEYRPGGAQQIQQPRGDEVEHEEAHAVGLIPEKQIVMREKPGSVPDYPRLSLRWLRASLSEALS